MSKRIHRITVRLTVAEERAVRAEAARRKVDVSVVMREAVTKCLTRKQADDACKPA